MFSNMLSRRDVVGTTPQMPLWQFSDNEEDNDSDNELLMACKSMNLSSSEEEDFDERPYQESPDEIVNDIFASMRLCRVLGRDHTGAIEDDIARINSRSLEGDAPLHIACRNGQIRRIRELLLEGHDPNERNEVNKTPLHEGLLSLAQESGSSILIIYVNVQRLRMGNLKLFVYC